MNILSKIIKLTKYRFLNAKFSTLFLTFSLVISMLLISLGTSFVTQFLRAQEAKERAMPPNGCQVSFYSEMDKNIKLSTIYKMLESLKPGEGAMLNDLMVHLDASEVNSYCTVSAQYFAPNAEKKWQYPIIQGRSYTSEEISQGKKVVLIGKGLESCVESKSGKRYLLIEGERYEVIGKVGLENQVSLWDNRVFMPATALPGSEQSEIEETNAISMIVYNSSGGVEEALERMQGVGEKEISGLQYENHGELKVENILVDIRNNADSIFFLAILGYLMTLVYSINLVQFWVTKRQYEIGVRKAFGYTNRNIMGMLGAEMTGILIVSLAVALLIQVVLRVSIGTIWGYTFQLYSENLLVGFVVVVLTALLVSFCSVCKVLRISPAIILKEEADNA